MDFGSLIFNLQPEERSSIRTVEKISKKLITAEFAVIFNNVCLKENMVPKCTDIYISI